MVLFQVPIHSFNHAKSSLSPSGEKYYGLCILTVIALTYDCNSILRPKEIFLLRLKALSAIFCNTMRGNTKFAMENRLLTSSFIYYTEFFF